jgi:hypothetical protein
MRRTRNISRPSGALGLCIVMATASLPAVAAEPEAEAAAEAPQLDPLVEIVVSEDVEDRDFILEGLRQETDRQLDIQQVAHEVDPTDPKKIRVEITGAALQYQITTDVERHGKFLRDAKTVNCECSKSDLVIRALAEIVASLDELDQADQAATKTPLVDEGDPPPPDDPKQDRPKRLTWLGGIGIGLVVLGVGGIGGGAAMVAIGETTSDRAGGSRERTNLRPPGYAVLGVGVAALVGGIVAIVIDKKRLREDRKTTFLPYFDGTTTGLALRTRF